jgi:hypothetical protein
MIKNVKKIVQLRTLRKQSGANPKNIIKKISEHIMGLFFGWRI